MLNKISVLMTVYNGERYLKKSIKSILDQTHINFEFIIVDDYSDDASVAVVEKFNDKRINLFKLENKFGRTKALNFGLKKCNSDFIAIQDADDISNKERFSNSLNYLTKNNGIGLVCSDYERIDENDNLIINKKNTFNENDLTSRLKFTNLIPHSSIIFKRKKKLNGELFLYDESFTYAQDYKLILQYLRDSQIFFIRDKLVKIRSHKKNMTNNKQYKKLIIRENLRLLEFSKRFLISNFSEKIKIKFFKLKNYFKLFLSYLGD